jgi:asparagine synthase (glutamine-hydrolysing)
MAAIYGVIGDASRMELEAMAERLAHRGAFGAHWSPAPGVWLGMQSRNLGELATDGPLLFDGVLDNRWALATRRSTRALRPDPEPDNDALLLTELLESEGPDALALLAGPFAVAWWRGRERTLLLARDRIGYGPLHFTVDRAGRFLFASEYKALLALDTVDARPNRDAIQVLQNSKWTKPGETCLAGIYPVAPGTMLEVDAGRLAMKRYWHIPVAVQHADEERHAAELRGVSRDAALANRRLPPHRRLDERRARLRSRRRRRAPCRRQQAATHVHGRVWAGRSGDRQCSRYRQGAGTQHRSC